MRPAAGSSNIVSSLSAMLDHLRDLRDCPSDDVRRTPLAASPDSVAMLIAFGRSISNPLRARGHGWRQLCAGGAVRRHRRVGARSSMHGLASRGTPRLVRHGRANLTVQ